MCSMYFVLGGAFYTRQWSAYVSMQVPKLPGVEGWGVRISIHSYFDFGCALDGLFE
jgi:hypothetical protein